MPKAIPTITPDNPKGTQDLTIWDAMALLIQKQKEG